MFFQSFSILFLLYYFICLSFTTGKTRRQIRDLIHATCRSIHICTLTIRLADKTQVEVLRLQVDAVADLALTADYEYKDDKASDYNRADHYHVTATFDVHIKPLDQPTAQYCAYYGTWHYHASHQYRRC